MSDAEKMAQFFKVLSVDKRVRIVQLLAEGSLSVGVLSSKLGISPGAVSQHLRIMRDAGLVAAERRGYFIHYKRNPEAIAGLQAYLEELVRPSS
jgi:ArsR family transcriptional regulator, arsenate/arsenite/antimonite-responsive transcriptional repressor